MDAKVRSIGFCGAVLLAGAIGGITLGNFVTAGAGPTGADELAAYWSEPDTEAPDDALGLAGYDAPVRDGPTSYHCEGCDSGLHREASYLEPAEYAPLPPYEVVDLEEPAISQPGSRKLTQPQPARPRDMPSAERAVMLPVVSAAPIIETPKN